MSLTKFSAFSLTRSEMKDIKGGGQCGYQTVIWQKIGNPNSGGGYSYHSYHKWVPASYNSSGQSIGNAKKAAAANGTHYCCDRCPWNNQFA